MCSTLSVIKATTTCVAKAVRSPHSNPLPERKKENCGSAAELVTPTHECISSSFYRICTVCSMLSSLKASYPSEFNRMDCSNRSSRDQLQRHRAIPCSHRHHPCAAAGALVAVEALRSTVPEPGLPAHLGK